MFQMAGIFSSLARLQRCRRLRMLLPQISVVPNSFLVISSGMGDSGSQRSCTAGCWNLIRVGGLGTIHSMMSCLWWSVVQARSILVRQLVAMSGATLHAVSSPLMDRISVGGTVIPTLWQEDATHCSGRVKVCQSKREIINCLRSPRLSFVLHTEQT